MKKLRLIVVLSSFLLPLANIAYAQTSKIELLEQRISTLEGKLVKNNNTKKQPARNIYGNKFNPSIGIILNGQYTTFSENASEIAGFAVGEEGERGNERFSIGESELNFSSNIDDKFYGSMTAAIVREDGEDKIELEEAFIRTSPGFGLLDGMEIKAGRAFWNLGYLNEHHAHADDFADRPLTHRAFLNKSFNDDGVQVSYVLPTSFYSEIGGGSFAGNDFPFGPGDGTGNYLAYLRLGGDITANQNFRIGGYVLSGEARGGRFTEEEVVSFTGDTDLYVADLRYEFAPTGNENNQLITITAEYFERHENGAYDTDATDNAVNPVNVDNESSGYYAQLVYKFHKNWRIGTRYSKLSSATVPAGLVGGDLDPAGRDADSKSVMIDWTNSEFSRIRLQYNNEELSAGSSDEQFIIQYVVSFGAHGAHKY